MKILTLRYGWINFLSFDLYVEGDYEYVHSIFNDDDPPLGVFEPLVFKLLNTDHIEIVQDYSGNYFWSIF